MRIKWDVSGARGIEPTPYAPTLAFMISRGGPQPSRLLLNLFTEAEDNDDEDDAEKEDVAEPFDPAEEIEDEEENCCCCFEELPLMKPSAAFRLPDDGVPPTLPDVAGSSFASALPLRS